MLFFACFRFLIFHPFFQGGQLTPFAPMCGRPCQNGDLSRPSGVLFSSAMEPAVRVLFRAGSRRSVIVYARGTRERDAGMTFPVTPCRRSAANNSAPCVNTVCLSVCLSACLPACCSLSLSVRVFVRVFFVYCHKSDRVFQTLYALADHTRSTRSDIFVQNISSKDTTIY